MRVSAGVRVSAVELFKAAEAVAGAERALAYAALEFLETKIGDTLEVFKRDTFVECARKLKLAVAKHEDAKRALFGEAVPYSLSVSTTLKGS